MMTPPIEQAAFGNPVEVLRLQKDAMAEGQIFHREFAFMSDGKVFTRVNNLAGEGRGWIQVPQDWRDRGQLEHLAANQAAKGWTAIWHPAHDPALKEFTKVVPAEGLLDRKEPFSLREF